MRKMAFNCSFATYASFKSAKCEHKNFFARFFCFFVFQIVSIWRFLCSQFHLKSEQIVSYRFRQLNLTKTICTPLVLERHNKNWLPQSLGDRIMRCHYKRGQEEGDWPCTDRTGTRIFKKGTWQPTKHIRLHTLPRRGHGLFSTLVLFITLKERVWTPGTCTLINGHLAQFMTLVRCFLQVCYSVLLSASSIRFLAFIGVIMHVGVNV